MNKIIKIILLSMILLLMSPSETNAALSAGMIVVPCAADSSDSCKKAQEARRIYSERARALAPYEVVFAEVGVNLTATTSESQYNSWYERVVAAKVSYDRQQEKIAIQKEAEERIQKELIEQEKAEKIRKENESQEKIIELERRVHQLETQKNATSTPIVQKTEEQISTVTASVVPTKTVQVNSSKKTVTMTAPIKKEEIKPTEVKSSTSSVNLSQAPVEQIPIKNFSWWERLFNWFKK